MADFFAFPTTDGGRYAVMSWRGMDIKVAVKPSETFANSRIYGCKTFGELFKEKPLKIPSLRIESLDELLLILLDVIALRIDEFMLNTVTSAAEVSTSSKLLADLSAIGWQNIIKADHKLGHFIFKLGKIHILDCQIFNGSYKCSIEPRVANFRELEFSSVNDAYGHAAVQLSSLSVYITFIAKCKELFHVIESDDGRINVLKTPGCWISLRFDPSNLSQEPVSEGLALVWDTSIEPIDNMKLNFPIASDLKSLECGVCSSTKDSQGNWSDFNCSSSECNQPFHRACLLEWFLADPRSVKSFGQTHGLCPFCEQTNILEM